MLLFSILALAFYFGQIAPVQACSCSAPATAAEAFEKSTAVFRGRVTKISIPSLDWIGLTRTGAHRVKFEVLKQWKGAASESAAVVTRLSSEGCGFPFEEQKEYLVFVVAEQKHVQSGICTGTKAVSDAEQEIEELDRLILTPTR